MKTAESDCGGQRIMCSKNVDGNSNNGSATLSRFSILVGFLCALSYFGAFVGTGWVYTKESYRLANLNLYTSVTFKIGLWRACHSFKKINSTISTPIPGCTSISYTNWNEIMLHNIGATSDIESTISVITRIRWCTIFVGLGLVLLLIGLTYSIVGHYCQDNKTLLASAVYTLSGLSLAAGLFIFVCVLTDSFAHHSSSTSYYDRHSWDVYDSRRVHDYKYGWCFLTAGVACISAEIVAVLCMTVHYRRCQTIAEVIKDIMPIIEDKSSNSYYSSNETGCLIRADDATSTKIESKMSALPPPPPPPDDSNGILSETPPDICSTFLSGVDPADEHLESIMLPEKQSSSANEKFVHCTYNKNKKTCNFATLNARNYRCVNYSSSGVAGAKRYSTLGGCNATAVDGPCSSSSASSSSTFSHPAQYQHHQNATSCVQNTIPRAKNCPAAYAGKYHAVEKGANLNAVQKLTADVTQSSCDDFNL